MKREVARIGASGFIEGPGLHDGSVVGTHLAVDRECMLEVRTVAGALATLHFVGTRAFGALGYRDHAIVSDVFVYAVTSALSEGSALESSWSVLFGGDLPIEDVRFQALKFARETPTLRLVSIETSYGGALSILCDEVLVSMGS